MNPFNSQKTHTDSSGRQKPGRQRGLIINLTGILLLVGLYMLVRSFMQGDVINGQVPQLELTTLSGEEIHLKEIDEPTLIHFWATWCPICDYSRNNVENVAEDYPVINIATQSEGESLLKAYAQQNNMNPAIIVNDKDGTLMQTFGAKAVPADFIVGPDGEIKFIEVGYTTELGLRIRLWLAGWE